MLKRLSEQLKANGVVDHEAMARNILIDRGHLDPSTDKLTELGQERSDMGNEGRALDRAGQREGYATVYDSETNKTKRYKL